MEFRKIPEQLESLINISELEAALENPLWYLSSSKPWGPIIDQYYLNPSDEGSKTAEWEAKKLEYTWLLAKMLEDQKVALGAWEPYYNDDERVLPQKIAVIHHTSTWEDTPISYIDALGLVRLYVPLFRDGVWGRNQPISSGHFYQGRQLFVGYHWLVYSDGTSIQVLDDNCMGFQAGDLSTNNQSISFACVGDLQDSTPTAYAIEEINRILQQKYVQVTTIFGHRDVLHQGKHVNTICPGNRWEEWKDSLIIP